MEKRATDESEFCKGATSADGALVDECEAATQGEEVAEGVRVDESVEGVLVDEDALFGEGAPVSEGATTTEGVPVIAPASFSEGVLVAEEELTTGVEGVAEGDKFSREGIEEGSSMVK